MFGPIKEINSKKPPPQVNILSCQRLYTAIKVIRCRPLTASAEGRQWSVQMKPAVCDAGSVWASLKLSRWPWCRFRSGGWRTSPVFSSCYTCRSESDQHVHCLACFSAVSHFSAQLCFTTRLLKCWTSKRSQSGFTLICLSALWYFLFVCQSQTKKNIEKKTSLVHNSDVTRAFNMEKRKCKKKRGSNLLSSLSISLWRSLMINIKGKLHIE